MSDKEKHLSKKGAKRQATVHRRNIRRIWSWIISLVVVGALSYGIYSLSQNAGPEGEDFSHAIPIMGSDHIAVGGSNIIEYNSDPPTSGSHYGQTARSGFREEQIPDGYLIHNLEHGDIWISYHPRIADDVRNELRQFSHAKVIITPREENDTEIALAAWGQLDAFNLDDVGGELPTQRIHDFISRYMNRGPEQIPGASGGV